jgi:hypothetical protein
MVGPSLLCRAFSDCLKVHQAGLPCVVALMGARCRGAKNIFSESTFMKSFCCWTATTLGGVLEQESQSAWCRKSQLGWWKFPEAPS